MAESLNPRPTRALIVVTVFMVGSFPPVVWAISLTMMFFPLAVVVPLGSLVGMAMALAGLWRPASAGWVTVAVFFGVGWTIALLYAVSSLEAGRADRDALFAAAGLTYFSLAVASILAVMPPWTRWAEEQLRRDGGSRV